MKRVIAKDEVKEKIKQAINLLCDSVSSTLGPSGNNVLINNSERAPFITNDGVTIAKNIESTDPVMNSVLEIIKESTLKTDELVGDGTTTTLVLLQSIFLKGLEEIENGKNSIELKKELKESLEKIIPLIEEKKRIPNKEELISIARISGNSSLIGDIASEVFFKMRSKYAIQLDESTKEKTYYEIKKGYNIEIDELSNMYFQNRKEIILNDCYFCIIKGYLSSLEQISEVINEGIKKSKNIVIFVEEMEDAIKQELLVYYLMEKKNIFIIKLPEYGSRKEKIELDISYLSNSIIKNIDYEEVFCSDLGRVDKVVINQKEIIIETNNKKAKELVEILRKELAETRSDYEKEFIENRLSKLENGIATIYVGGITKTEIKEKMMRYEDALCALEIANHGVLPGGGVSFLEISDKIKVDSVGDKILKEALEVPFQKMLENAGSSNLSLKMDIKKSNYTKIVNFTTLELEDINNTEILDPKEVLITALKNAVSVAALLLTINYLVVNENESLEKNSSIVY